MTKTIATLAILVGTGIIAYFYVYDQQWGTYHALGADAAHFEDIRKEFDALKQDYEKLDRERLAISDEDRGRIDASIPQGPLLKELLVMIEYFSGTTGVALGNVTYTLPPEEKDVKNAPAVTGTAVPAAKAQPQPGGSVVSSPKTQNGGNVRELTLNIGVDGSYEAFKNFHSALEKNLPLFDASSISFHSSNDASGGPSNKGTSYAITIKNYYQ